MNNWALGYIESNQEKNFVDWAKRKSFEIYIPMVKVKTKPRRKSSPVEVMRPVFRNYVFVRMDIGSIRKAEDFPHYLYTIKTSEGICAVRDSEIEFLKERAENGGFELTNSFGEEVSAALVFEIGDKVKMRSGPFRGLEGIVLKSDEKKSSIVLSVSGKTTKIPLSFLKESG